MRAKIYTSFVPCFQKRISLANSLFMRSNCRRTSHRTVPSVAVTCTWQIVDIQYCIIDRERCHSSKSCRSSFPSHGSARTSFSTSCILHANHGTREYSRKHNLALSRCASIDKYIDRSIDPFVHLRARYTILRYNTPI